MRQISIEEVKSIQLSILDSVHNFCCNNNLTYYLAYGTLIGAVRHKGYIPWDDDIDICMPRPDYDRFISVFNLLQKKYKVLCFEENNLYLSYYAKICDLQTVVQEEFHGLDFSIGVNVDVFPINAYKGRFCLIKQSILKKINNIKQSKTISTRKWYKNVILSILRLILFIIPAKAVIKKIIKNSKSKPFSEAKHVYVESYCSYIGKPLEKELFSAKVLMSFEGKEYFAMKGYDELLKNKYGDYMKLPPENERVPKHNITAHARN